MEGKYFRLDHLLVIKRLAESRTKAQYLIETGCVKVNDRIITKSSKKFSEADQITVTTGIKYVSRAGYKLEEFMKEYNKIEISEKIACDIGSSTGGFVDYLLQNGVRKVFAVDVNIRQLHPKISSDERVIKIEKNAKLLSRDDIKEELDIVTIDVSFISLRKLLMVLDQLCGVKTTLITLIKPQFETEKTKNGVVTKREVHIEVLKNVLESFNDFGFFPNYLTYSKLLGSDGNIEFFCAFSKNFITNKKKNYEESGIIRVVDMAWEALK